MNISTLCNILSFIKLRKCIAIDVANSALVLLIKHYNIKTGLTFLICTRRTSYMKATAAKYDKLFNMESSC